MQNILRQKNGTVDMESADVDNEDVGNKDVRNADAVNAGMRNVDAVNADIGNAGLRSVGDQDNILIHDAVRPLLTQKLLRDCFAMLPGHDGVMPTLPMKDTVYLSRDGSMVPAQNLSPPWAHTQESCPHYRPHPSRFQNPLALQVFILYDTASFNFVCLCQS